MRPRVFEGNQLLGMVDRMRSAFVGRDEIIQRGAEVTRGTTQSLPSGQTVVTFASAIKDTDGLWSAGQPTRLTAKVQGWYVCSANSLTFFSSGYTNGIELIMSIRKGGAGGTTIAANNWVSGSNSNAYINVARVIYLNTGEYIEMVFTHAFAGGFVVQTAAYSPVLSMVRYP